MDAKNIFAGVEGGAKDSPFLSPDTIFATIMDANANTAVDKISAKSITHLIFSGLLYIYDKYSTHKDKYPSFSDFKVYFIHENDTPTGDISVTFHEKDSKEYKFIIKITKTDLDISKLDISIDLDDELLSVYFHKGWHDDSDKLITECEMMSIKIPYELVGAGVQNIISHANTESYKDIHDTIIGFNLFFPRIYKSSTTCLEQDIDKDDKFRNYPIGEDIAYKKALTLKIKDDIIIHERYAQLQHEKISTIKKDANKHMRTARRCKRSLNKLKSLIKRY